MPQAGRSAGSRRCCDLDVCRDVSIWGWRCGAGYAGCAVDRAYNRGRAVMNLREKKTKCFLLCVCIGGMAVCALLGWQDGLYLCAGGACAAFVGEFDE